MVIRGAMWIKITIWIYIYIDRERTYVCASDRDKSLNRRVYWPCSSKSLGCRWIYARSRSAIDRSWLDRQQRSDLAIGLTDFGRRNFVRKEEMAIFRRRSIKTWFLILSNRLRGNWIYVREKLGHVGFTRPKLVQKSNTIQLENWSGLKGIENMEDLILKFHKIYLRVILDSCSLIKVFKTYYNRLLVNRILCWWIFWNLLSKLLLILILIHNYSN